MAKRFFLFLGVASFFLIFSSSAFPARVYDNFDVAGIDKTKWEDGTFLRRVEAGKLLMKIESPSPSVMTTFPFTYSGQIRFANPNSINSIQAEVTVLDSTVVGNAVTKAGITGRFFNNGLAGGGYAGDVWAEIRIWGNSSGLSARYYVGKYDTAEDVLTDVRSGTLPTPTLSAGTPYVLSIAYNSSANQFTFTVRAGSNDYTATVGTGQGLPAYVGPAQMPFKGFMVFARSVDATGRGAVTATYDNVYINGSASPYDDFSSPTLSTSNWANIWENAREVVSGRLHSLAKGSAVDQGVPIEFPFGFSPGLSFNKASPLFETNFIRATVTPRAFSGNGYRVTARMSAWAYNDGSSSPPSYVGDVVILVGLYVDSGVLRGKWGVARNTEVNSNPCTYQWLAEGFFNTPISLHTPYRLLLGFDGQTAYFMLNDEVATYTPSTPIYNANNENFNVGSRIVLCDGTQDGMMDAEFDDIVTSDRHEFNRNVDSKTDIGAFHLPTDQFFTDYGGNLGQYGWGGPECYPLIWDYDGDGLTDLSFYHIPTNQWFVKGYPGDNLGQYGWGGDECIPVPGDYNGDGSMERAFYHWPTNRWWVEGQAPVDFGYGGAASIPIAMDYDGDGITDMMIYHIDSNQWFVYGIGELGQFGWAGADCLPVPGDWNGDGKIEVGIYFVPDNEWIWRDAANNPHFMYQYGWGGAASFPIPGDYNGDGTIDRAFYRPAENWWFIEGQSDFVWGWGGQEFMPITSQMNIFNWFRFIRGMFQP